MGTPHIDIYIILWYNNKKLLGGIIMPAFMDLTGKRFGHLTVIERAEKKSGKNRWKCLCDCGKITYTITNRLVQGKTLSCGCRAYDNPHIKHGMKNTHIYQVWQGMKKRCNNEQDKRYKDYGGRNIKLCDEWNNDFSAFYNWAINNGYSENLSIERINVDKGYCPENCRWIPLKEQAKNKRNTIIIEHNGEKKPLVDWCSELNIPYKQAVQRYRNLKRNNKDLDFEKIFFSGNRTLKKVYQISLDGNIIKQWDSLAEAERNGYAHKYVSQCCKGISKTAYGYIWKFV